MNEYTLVFPGLNIPNTIMFRGTEEEKEEATRKENKRAAEFAELISSPSFLACEYHTTYKGRVILHKSTRRGVKYQLSFISPDGMPAMHENFVDIGGDPEEVGVIHTFEELLWHFVAVSNKDMYITVLSR